MYSAVIDDLQDKLSEEGVLPCEPLAGKYLAVVLVERLVHEACSGVCGHELADAVADLVVAVRCESLHHDAHRPDHFRPDMRSSDTFTCRSAVEVRVCLASYELSGIHVDRIVCRNIAEVAHREE